MFDFSAIFKKPFEKIAELADREFQKGNLSVAIKLLLNF